MDAKCTMKCQLTHVLPHKNKLALNTVQLSPEGEVNRGGYTKRQSVEAYIERCSPTKSKLKSVGKK